MSISGRSSGFWLVCASCLTISYASTSSGDCVLAQTTLDGTTRASGFASDLNNVGGTEAERENLLVATQQIKASTSIKQLVEEGNAALKTENYTLAETIWRQVIQLAPNLTDAHYSLGLVFTHQGRWEEAITSFRRAISLDPKLAWAHNNLGNALAEVGQVEEAITSFRRAIELAPDKAEFYHNLGLTFAEKGRWEEALEAYRHTIDTPDDALAYFYLGNELYHNGQNEGDKEGAIVAFRRTIKLNPSNALAYTSLGAVLTEQGKLDEAITLHKRAISLEPKLAIAYTNLGVTLYKQGQVEEARANFHRSIELAPNELESFTDFDTYVDVSTALRKLGRFEESIEPIRRAININPYIGNGASCHLLSEVLEPLNIPFELIIRQYKKVWCDLKIFAQSPAQLNEVLDKTSEIIYRAIALKPSYAQVHKKLGLAEDLPPQMQSGVDKHQPVTRFALTRSSISISFGSELHWLKMHDLPEDDDPKTLNRAYAVAYFNLGTALLMRAMLTGEEPSMSQAILSFQSGIKHDSSYAWNYVYSGIALTAQNRLTEAIKASNQVIQLPNVQIESVTPASTHALAHNMLAYALQLQGNLKESIKEYKKAIQSDPNFMSAHHNLKDAEQLLKLR